jgi:hypothetical protein
MNVVFSGGLGNQMFQYALYLSLKQSGRKVKMDTSLYSHLRMHNGFELEKCFAIQTKNINYSSFKLFRLRILLKFKPYLVLYQDKGSFDQQVFLTKCPYVHGYWQSEKYFSQIQSMIKKSFMFRGIDVKNDLIATEIRSSNSVGLHIRRGDYLKSSSYVNICNTSYYNRAVNTLLDKMDNSKDAVFYVFSDDKIYAEQFVRKLNVSYKMIKINDAQNSYLDMFLMSQCKHNIIANSSFSWWGAWLNNCPKKIVIAPKIWFSSNSKIHYKNIVPDSWTKI